jgi:hypothetical protein
VLCNHPWVVIRKATKEGLRARRLVVGCFLIIKPFSTQGTIVENPVGALGVSSFKPIRRPIRSEESHDGAVFRTHNEGKWSRRCRASTQPQVPEQPGGLALHMKEGQPSRPMFITKARLPLQNTPDRTGKGRRLGHPMVAIQPRNRLLIESENFTGFPLVQTSKNLGAISTNARHCSDDGIEVRHDIGVDYAMRCVGVGKQLERQPIATMGTGVKNNPGLKHRVEQFCVQGSAFWVGSKPVRKYLLVRSKEINGLHAIAAQH